MPTAQPLYVAQWRAVDKAFAEPDMLGSLKKRGCAVAAIAPAGNF
jgi:hypothetical protein